METESFLLPAAVFLAGVVASGLLPRRHSPACYILYAAGAFVFGAQALQGLIHPAAQSAYFQVSHLLTFGFTTTGLSYYFCLALSVLGAAVSIYSIGYSANASSPKLQAMLYGLFLLSMYAVFLSADILTFLVCWETMSVVSYFLVTSDIEKDESKNAGLLYATMTHVGTAFIIAAFMVLYAYTGSLDFASIKQALPSSGAPVDVVFVLALIGFGTKAGIVPLHTWLPRAHPAAPSNISALMSGVMIKAGVYGIVFVVVDILGGGAPWWGIVVLVVGGVSSVLGVMYALMENDMKRLLAYSSIENVGIILLGVGASMLFYSNGLVSLSGFALAAALYHIMNHAAFKGLLFLGAGSVLHSTHTKDMEQMGGLIKKMPWTGLFFLVGSLAICALPPFNGFISEWLTFQSLILGIKTSSMLSKALMLMGGSALALTGALAAACFVKAFGISFLGQPRGDAAVHAKEASPSMLTGMAALSLLCLCLGIFPGYLLAIIGSIPVGGLPSLGQVGDGAFITAGDGFASLSAPVLFFFMVSLGAAAYLAVGIATRKRKATCADSWDCGIRRLTPRMQYTATAFTKPLRIIFKNIYMPRKDIKISYIIKPFFAREIVYGSDITPVFESYLYRPFSRALHATAHRIRRLQSGSLHLYLGYILVTLVTLLLVWG